MVTYNENVIINAPYTLSVGGNVVSDVVLNSPYSLYVGGKPTINENYGAYLCMTATDPSSYVLIKSHMVTIPDVAPILTIDQGLWGLKDIDSLGYLSTTSKTQLTFSSTYTNCVPTDIGKRIRVNGARIDELVLAYYKNEYRIWWLSGSTSSSASISSGAQITIDNGTGAGTISEAALVSGGGAIRIGHGFEGPTDVPKIMLTDTEQGYNKLYIREANGTTPAHLDLGDLTAHGNATIAGTLTTGGQFNVATNARIQTGANVANAAFLFTTGDRGYWGWYLYDSSTGSGNTGNNLTVFRYGDDAAYLGIGFKITRSNGNFEIAGSLNMGSANVYCGGTNLLKTDDAFLCVGDLTTYGNFHGAGYITVGGDNYIGWSNGSGGFDVYMRRAAANVLAIDNGTGGLGELNCSIMKCDFWQPTATGDLYHMSNIRMYTSGLNIFPQSNNNGNVGGDGSGTSYYWGAIWSHYIKYKSAPSSFDAVDDLDLIRQMKTTQIDGKDVIDPKTTMHLIDDHGFYESSRMDGWHLSVQRKMVEKLDEHDVTNAELLSRIEELSAEVEDLKTKLPAA